ncbi:hypothetical protein [Streptomyces oceani]|uniref:Uncharacterized protein n=1 Tax=Streptomyces oceani TaxID=1075402 RepID=A0A1E7JXU3_9ACTN|nr:hypothetical protein [Streptomyces oceani]OEU96498.1 hypothetical protein AN216_19555 [Streptomyces oceani]
MRAIVGLWRWRHNPVCRRTDRHEAVLALCAVVLIVLGAPVVGLASGKLAHVELLDYVRDQHAERYSARATVQQLAPGDPGSETNSGSEPREEDGLRRVVAFWTGPNGITQTGTTEVSEPVRPGDRFRVWVDGQGQVTNPPMSADSASSHAMLAGVVSAGLAVCAVEAGRRLAVRQLLRRRYARWDEAWARIGPDPGRTGPGN